MVVDYFTVTDAGRIINPLTIHGQAIGSVVQGLGGALLENLFYDDNGQFLAGTFADYLLPSAADFPRVRAKVVELFPSPSNPLGAKGGGEGGIIPTGGVIANAVAAALASLNIQPKSLPLTPPKIWALIHAAESEKRMALEKETV
jgi:carbon-monoxide dehydrogenase large subunit